MKRKIEYRVVITDRNAPVGPPDPEEEAQNLKDLIMDGLGHPSAENVSITVEAITVTEPIDD